MRAYIDSGVSIQTFCNDLEERLDGDALVTTDLINAFLDGKGILPSPILDEVRFMIEDHKQETEAREGLNKLRLQSRPERPLTSDEIKALRRKAILYCKIHSKKGKPLGVPTFTRRVFGKGNDDTPSRLPVRTFSRFFIGESHLGDYTAAVSEFLKDIEEPSRPTRGIVEGFDALFKDQNAVPFDPTAPEILPRFRGDYLIESRQGYRAIYVDDDSFVRDCALHDGSIYEGVVFRSGLAHIFILQSILAKRMKRIYVATPYSWWSAASDTEEYLHVSALVNDIGKGSDKYEYMLRSCNLISEGGITVFTRDGSHRETPSAEFLSNLEYHLSRLRG